MTELSRTEPAWPRRRHGMLLAAVPFSLLGLLAYSQRWIGGDGLLVARTAENLASGHGPVINAGERVEATTSPLWVALVSLGHLLTRFDASTVAVYAGLVLGLAGVGAGMWAAWLLWSDGTPGRLALPLGLVVLLAWDGGRVYLTSGTQTGLVLAWLGLAYLRLVAEVGPGGRPGRGWPLPLLLGLGPLVDPVLAFPALAFAAVWLRHPAGRRRRLVGVALALAPSALYSVFRAGYYAALLPAPLISRQAGPGSVGEAWRYLAETLIGQWLWLPLLALPLVFGRGAAGRRTLLLAPVGAGVAIASAQVAAGTTSWADRALIPVVMLVLLPFLVVLWPATVAGRVPSRTLAGTLVVLVWAGLAGTHVASGFDTGDRRFPQERAVLVLAGQFPPGNLSRTALSRMGAGADASALTADAADFFRVGVDGVRYPAEAGRGVGVWQADAAVVGYLAPSVLVVDDVGVLDPVTSRLRYPDPVPVIAGNRRVAPADYAIAAHSVGGPDDSAAVAQARVVLTCEPVARLRAATRRGLTVDRFLDNLWHAWDYTVLEIPADPAVAAQELC